MTKTVIRIAFTIILILLSAVKAEPKTSNTIHMPLIASGYREVRMSDWQVIIPEPTTQLFTDPSFGQDTITAEWTVDDGAGAGTAAVSTAFSKFGVSSMEMVFGAPRLNVFTNITTAAADHTISAYVRKSGGGDVTVADFRFIIDGGAVAPDSFTMIDDNWAYAVLTVTETAAAHFTGFESRTGTIYVDGVQFEQKGEATTYCDGDQDGCEWNGPAHASTSQRSAQSRAGGFVRDLRDDFGFAIARMIDVGAAPQSLLRSEFETQPGGITSNVKINSRVFALTGTIFPTTDLADLHAQRQALFSVLDPQAVPQTAAGPQPVILRYTGAAVVKEIAAHYEGGLEANIGAIGGEKNETFTIRLLADDPFWYAIGQSAAVLDSNDTATTRFVAARLKSTGQWSDLGLTANPTGGFGFVFAVCISKITKIVYVGGSWTGFDGNAGWDYIVQYTPSTDTWARVGGAADFNGAVNVIVEGPDGTIYAAGAFTNVAGAGADYLAQWDGANWTAVGDPDVGAALITEVNAMAFDSAGALYVGGAFTNWANVANADYFAKWNGAVWSAIGAGGTGAVNAIVFDSSDNIYIGGGFLNWSADGNADNLAWWNGAVWAAVQDTAFNGQVDAMAIDEADNIFIRGGFTDIGDENGDFITQYNGTAFLSLGTGLDNSASSLVIAPDGTLIAGGQFDTAGGLTTTDGLAQWDGSSWAHLDIDLPGAKDVRAIAVGQPDPIINQNYDLWIGNKTSGVAAFAGLTTVTNAATAPATPQIVIIRSGGTSATVQSVRNTRTGQEILYSGYRLLDGETLTVDLRPSEKTVTSSFFGSRSEAVLPGSDLGTWVLQKDDNDVTAFVETVGAPTITAYLLWRDTYKAND